MKTEQNMQSGRMARLLKGMRFAAIFSTSLLIATCTPREYYKAGKYSGSPVSMGHGQIQTFVEVNEEAVPSSVGVTMSETALEHLPHDSTSHVAPEFIAYFPHEAFRIPYTHLVINYNKKGHVPTGVYDKEHFDVHFYYLSEAERTAIPAYDQDSVRFKSAPPAAYFPANYIMAPGGEPRMGAHWVDVTSEELQPPPNNKPFRQTIVYGSYNGKITFLEPMITLAFMRNEVGLFTRSIPRPDRVQHTGFYPNTLRIEKSGSNFVITLLDFEFREAS